VVCGADPSDIDGQIKKNTNLEVIFANEDETNKFV